MTVAEYIKELQALPQDAICVQQNEEDELYCETEGPVLIDVFLRKRLFFKHIITDYYKDADPDIQGLSTKTIQAVWL